MLRQWKKEELLFQFNIDHMTIKSKMAAAIV